MLSTILLIAIVALFFYAYAASMSGHVRDSFASLIDWVKDKFNDISRFK